MLQAHPLRVFPVGHAGRGGLAVAPDPGSTLLAPLVSFYVGSRVDRSPSVVYLIMGATDRQPITLSTVDVL